MNNIGIAIWHTAQIDVDKAWLGLHIYVLVDFSNRTTPRRREKFSSHLTDYTEENYPEFCSGMAYLVTPDLATDFLKASTMVIFILILGKLHQCFTSSFYASISQNHKKIPMMWQSLLHFGDLHA